MAGGEVIDEGVATLGDGEPNICPVVRHDAIVILPCLSPSFGKSRLQRLVESDGGGTSICMDDGVGDVVGGFAVHDVVW